MHTKSNCYRQHAHTHYIVVNITTLDTHMSGCVFFLVIFDFHIHLRRMQSYVCIYLAQFKRSTGILFRNSGKKEQQNQHQRRVDSIKLSTVRQTKNTRYLYYWHRNA